MNKPFHALRDPSHARPCLCGRFSTSPATTSGSSPWRTPPEKAGRCPCTCPARSSRTCWRRWSRPRRGSAGGRRWWSPPTTSGRATWRASCAPTWRRAASATTPRAAPATPRTSRRRPHLVGLRIAALDALADSEPAVVVASAVALAEAVPDASLRPAGFALDARRGGRPRRGRRASWSRPATSAPTRSRSGGSSRFAAGSSTCSAPPRTGRRGWSCSATRSSRSAGSRPSPSARWATPSRWSCRPAAELASEHRELAELALRGGRGAARTSAELLPLERFRAPLELIPSEAAVIVTAARGDPDRAPRPLGRRHHGDARRRRAPPLRRRRRAARRARRDLASRGTESATGALLPGSGARPPPRAAWARRSPSSSGSFAPATASSSRSRTAARPSGPATT